MDDGDKGVLGLISPWPPIQAPALGSEACWEVSITLVGLGGLGPRGWCWQRLQGKLNVGVSDELGFLFVLLVQPFPVNWPLLASVWLLLSPRGMVRSAVFRRQRLAEGALPWAAWGCAQLCHY